MVGSDSAFDIANTLIDRLALKRRTLQFSSFNSIRQRAAASRRLNFSVPPLESPSAAKLLRVVGSGAAFAAHGLLPREAADLLKPLIAGGPGAVGMGGERNLLEPDDVLAAAPDLYRIGLHDALLDMVENYLCEPCLYLGSCLKLERSAAPALGTRQWHTDVEDDRIFRFIIYLNDVDEEGGPFTYIDASRSVAVRRALNYRSGFVSDAKMREILPEQQWRKVTGEAGTMIAFDGARMFHRASQPTGRDRFSITFTYVSRYPKQIWYATRLRRDSRRSLLPMLSIRQMECVPKARSS